MKPTLKLFQLCAILLLLGINSLYAQKTIFNGLTDESDYKSPTSERGKIVPEKNSRDFSCGDIFTDPRDGQQYTTVQIGEQCWMGENLNFGDQIPLEDEMANNGIAEKHCYDDDPANCDTYGALYQWNELMQYTLTEGIQGLCPDGWHIPDDAEWCTLEQTVDPSISCQAIFWRGVDGGTKLKAGGESGFEGLLGGYIFANMTSMQLGDFGYFWTSTYYSDPWAHFRALGFNNPGVRRQYDSKENSRSVRCLKGEGAENFPPVTPQNPTPENGATLQSVGVGLMWECSDPENDPLTYDVYLGTTNPPSLMQEGVTGNTFNPENLQYLTTYYWKIIAHDSQGNTTEGPLWNFSTQQQSGLFTCGQVYTDIRDGQQYNTVKIGDQCWMAENLNIGEQIESSISMTDNGTFEKYCYNNDPANCVSYGGWYQWDEMMQYSTTQGAQGICMAGWRLPTDNDWKTLEGYADSEFPIGDPEWDNWSWRGLDVSGNLKETGTTHWNSPNAGATNSTGFTALPNGYTSGVSFSGLNQMSWFWTSTQQDASHAISRYLHTSLTTSNRSDYGKTLAIGVRCIQGSTIINEPPATPSNPSPANGSTGQALDINLQWDCSDPDGDPLTYDVYLGTDENPPLLAEGITEDSFDPGLLEYYTDYYWKIVAHDDHGNSKEGPVWEFTTTMLFFTVTFTVFDEDENPLENAIITLDGVENAPGNYIFDEVPEGTWSYKIELENYVTAYGDLTVVDENLDVSIVLFDLVVVSNFPFSEDFSGGELPYGWRNTINTGTWGWEFALNPFPHAFIHNISRPAVNARLITPLLDATDAGQLTLGINQRFLTEPAGGTISILSSEDGLNWTSIESYTASIGNGDDFEYIEYDITPLAAGKQIFIALEADFPDTDANYEAVWEVESLTAYVPEYSVTFMVEDTSGNPINNATISLDEVSNPIGNYVFENLLAGTYQYIVKADGYLDNYGFVTLVDGNITDTIVMHEALTINEFPYTQDFENGMLPPGWNNITLGDPEGYWRFNEQEAQIMSNWGEHTHTMLVSPAFDCSDLEAAALGLNHYYMDIYGIGFAQIVISTDGDNWIPVETFQGEAVGSSDFPYFEYYLTQYAAGQEKVFIGLLYDDLAENEFWWRVDAFTFFEPMPYDVSVENISGNKYVEEGDSYMYEFEMVNKGSENDTYTLEVLNATWDYALSNESIAISAGETAVVTVEVTVPFDLEMGEKNEMMLKATSQGDAEVSTQDEFITIAISTIKSYYFENFDLAEVPEIPGGWSKIQQSSAYWARVETEVNLSIAPVSPPNNIAFNSSSDLNANLILISPMIDESVDLKDFRVLFKLRTGLNSGIKVGTMNSPTGTFNELATFSTPEHFTWEYFMYSFEEYQGSDRYIAFKMDISTTSSGAYMDDVTIEIIPPPILGVNPDSWDFGEYWVQYPSEVPLNIDVKNVGHDYLTVSNIFLDNPDDFLLDYDRTLLNTQVTWNENIPLTVHFNAFDVGPRNGNIVIEYNDGIDKTKYIPLEGVGLERPVGSTCDDPIYLELPVVDYENTTEFAGNDYNNFMVYPWAGLLGGYDMDFRFTLEEESYLSGSISGPYYGPSLYVMDQCPDENNPAILYTWIESSYGGSFEGVILPAGEHKIVISSPKAANPYTYYTPFVLNLTAEPTPDLHSVTFNLYEDSPEQSPVADAEISISGFQTNLTLSTNVFGQVQQNLYEYEYHVYIYKQDYEVHDFIFNPTSDTIVNIPMNDMIWTPADLSVQTEGLYPGQALFSWTPKPQGDPWNESFEDDYPPVGWDTIVTNHGQVEEPGYDWKFTWQKYGPVFFSDATVAPVDGEYQAFVHWSVEPQDEWLISQEFEAPAGNLEFWYYGTNGYPDNYGQYKVNVSTDNGETWTTIWRTNDLPYGKNAYDFPAVIDLQPWATQNIRIAWQAVGEYGVAGAWIIDKITVGDLRIDEKDLMLVSKTVENQTVQPEGILASSRDEQQVPPAKFEDMNYNLAQNRSNLGFSIYLDDLETPVAQGVQEPEYMFIALAAGDYTAGVQAVTTTGHSEIVTIPFNNPIGSVLYDVHFFVENESGIPMDNAQINVMYAGELVKSLQTINGNISTTLSPGSYDFTVFKDDYKTHYGQFSVTNANVDINVELEPGYQLQFIVKNNNDEAIQGATVSCAGLAKLTSTEGIAVFELDPGTFPYAVTHPYYDRVLSSVELLSGTSENVIMPDLSCEIPKTLTGRIENSAALLEWEAPNIGNQGTWIHWDREFGNNAIGNGGSLDFDVAQRFDNIDLRDYAGKFLTRIWFIPYTANCDYYVRVWTGGDINGPESLIVDQYVLNPVIGVWNEVFLITPVPINDNEELWFGIRNAALDGYPASVDVGPAVDGKGNMIRLPGNDWQTLLEVNPNLDYNWSVRGLVEDMDGTFPTLTALPDSDQGLFTGGLSVTNNEPDRSLYYPRLLLGYNVFRDDDQINNNLVELTSFTDVNLPAGISNYNITSVWSNGCESGFSNTVSLNNNCQQYIFDEGWNSMSAYIIPENAALETLFEPVQDHLIFMQNTSAFYWPPEGINTIGDFDNNSGYAVKFDQETNFEICGSDVTETEIQLQTGWNYLPVLSRCEVNTMELFGASINDIQIVQELIGNNVFWPEMNIYSLQNLFPGKAYKIKTSNPVTLNFPDCSKQQAVAKPGSNKGLTSVWGEITPTPTAQYLAIPVSANEEFIPGDVVAAFDLNGNICGFGEVNCTDEAVSVTIFGDDPTTEVKDGFIENEPLDFKLYREATNEYFELQISFDPSYGNASGLFKAYSFSMVKHVTLNETELEESSFPQLRIYPNPAHDKITIHGFEKGYNEDFWLEIFSAKGEKVFEKMVGHKQTLDIGHLKNGVYILKLSNENMQESKKLIIR